MTRGNEHQRLSTSWVRACIRGELIGFIPPAAIGWAMVSMDTSDSLLVAGLVGAGILEGAILGHTQNKVMQSAFPGVTGWAGATATAAGIAWLAGMGGSAILGAERTTAYLVLFVVLLFIVGLLGMGLFQWRRLYVAGISGSARWFPATTIAWILGVAIPVVALSFVPSTWPLAIHAAVGVTGAVLMGATVGIVTGRTLENLWQRQSASDS